MPAKFNPFPFAVLVEVPVTRADRRWPKATTKWVPTQRATTCGLCGSPKPADRSCDCFDNHCQ